MLGNAERWEMLHSNSESANGMELNEEQIRE
jgi:hypothetical protein